MMPEQEQEGQLQPVGGGRSAARSWWWKKSRPVLMMIRLMMMIMMLALRTRRKRCVVLCNVFYVQRLIVFLLPSILFTLPFFFPLPSKEFRV